MKKLITFIIVSCLIIMSIYLFIKYKNYNDAYSISKTYVKKVILGSKKDQLIEKIQLRLPQVDRDIIIKVVNKAKDDPELIKETALLYTDFFSLEEMNFLIKFETSPEGESIIIKQKTFSNEINKKKEQLLYMAKNVFDNNKKSFSAEALFYDENPDFLEMKNEIIDVSEKIETNPNDWYRKSFIKKVINEYPEDRREAFKNFIEKTLSDKLLENLSMNVIMHHLTDEEFKAYYKYRVSGAFLTLARFSRQNSKNRLIDMMNIYCGD